MLKSRLLHPEILEALGRAAKRLKLGRTSVRRVLTQKGPRP